MTYAVDAPDAMPTREPDPCCWSTQYYEVDGSASSLADPNTLALYRQGQWKTVLPC